LALSNHFLKQCWPLLALFATVFATPQSYTGAHGIGFSAQQAEFVKHITLSGSKLKGATAIEREETVVRFFHLVNQSGAEIKIRVLADGEELFVKRMKAKEDDPAGIVHPAPAQYPTLELKISMGREVKLLSVEESLYLKKRKTFTVSDSPGKKDAGFQIVVGKEGIAVTDDYYPIR
jgi:hypothetical protein